VKATLVLEPTISGIGLFICYLYIYYTSHLSSRTNNLRYRTIYLLFIFILYKPPQL